MTAGSALLERALQIATEAHAGQVDKTGHPYIMHPTRVAERVAVTHPDAPTDVQAVAYLHDVLEDTEITRRDLESAGIPLEVIDAVDALTKRPRETATDYFARVRANPWAVIVKVADIDDNTDPDRVAELDQPNRERLTAKYELSRRLLAAQED